MYSQEIINAAPLQPDTHLHSAPALDATATSSPTPTLSPTPVSTPKPPALVAALNSPQDSFNIYSESDSIWMMAKSLLPGILLLGLVIFVMKGKHR